MKNKKIDKLLDKYINGFRKNNGIRPYERYSSFDYCFNYFQSFKNKKDIANNKNLELSCLHLGFYLASWGMLRGSSFLLEKSFAYYKDIIKFISKYDKKIWNIDFEYSDADINLLIKFKEDFIKEFNTNKHNYSETLITKIMLGVFGSVPAYDFYFKKFLRSEKITQSFSKKSLYGLNEFYKNNEGLINLKSKSIKTFVFLSEKVSKINYTNAKIIDMIGFSYGIYNK